MVEAAKQASTAGLAAEIDAEICALPVRNTPAVRAVRRTNSQMLHGADGGYVLDLAQELLARYDQRWVAYELVRDHPATFAPIGDVELGQGIDNWWMVDAFARILSGPAQPGSRDRSGTATSTPGRAPPTAGGGGHRWSVPSP